MASWSSATAGRRKLYRHDELVPLIRPRSIAVVGASETKDGFGTRALQRVVDSAFGGPVFAVNPRVAPGRFLHGAPTVGSLSDIAGGVDCVLISVPASAVEQVVTEAAEQGCKSAIVFSAGFAEVSEEGRAAQRRILEIARSYGMLLGGPNTAGVINYRDGLPLTFVSDLAMELPVGNLAIVSQSAGIATHLGHVRHRGTGVSYTITTGNSADVTALDYVSFLLDDDATDVVALVMEGVDDAASFAEIGAKSADVGKPVLMIKCGRTDAGGRAAVSHTGSLAGNYEVFLAAAEQAGVQVMNTTEELVETAALFAKWAKRPYRRGGVGVITTMGGPGVMAADAAADAGVELPIPARETATRLGELVPAFAAVGNPIDTTASPTDPVLTQVIETVAADAAYAAVVMLTATMTGPSTAGRPAAIVAAAENIPGPLCAVWLSSWREGPGSETLDRHPEIPVFRSSDRCMQAIARWMTWHERLLARASESAAEPRSVLSADEVEQVGVLLSKFASAAGGALDEAQSREILTAVGIDVPRAAVVHSALEAADYAARVGFPVVAKVVSADLPHKAAAGGVALDLCSTEAVATAYVGIEKSVAEARPDARVDGILIAESLATTIEFMCGVIRDEIFGPVVVCGAGGGAVEQINDIARVVVPATLSSVRSAIGRTQIISRLRSSDPKLAEQAESSIASVVIRLAALAQLAPQVSELDVNPIVLRQDGSAVALDGLVVLGPASWDQ